MTVAPPRDQASARETPAFEHADGSEPTVPAVAGSKTVWGLAWPSMTSFALQAVVGFVDMLFVSRLGSSEAVAGVGIGSQVHFVAFALIAAVTTGTVALVARSTGSGDEREAARALRASLWMVSAIGVGLLAFAPWSEEIVALFGVSAEVARIGGSYLYILLLAGVPFGIGVTFASALRGAGDVRTPLLIGGVINLVNVVGDWMLVFGHWGAPRLGTDGSAIASAGAFAIGAGLFALLWASDRLVIERGGLFDGVSRDLCRRLLRIGVPTAVEHLAFNVGLFLFLRMMSSFGTDAVSAYLIGARILAFSFIPGLGFATAASALVGQHLGAADSDEAAAAGWRACVGALMVMTSVGLSIVVFAEPIAGWFGAAGGRTSELTVRFIYILGAAQPLMAIEFALGGALRGAGDTRFPLVALMTGLFAFRLGAAWVVLHVFDAGLIAVWSCLLADYLVKAVLLSIRFARGRWKELEI